MKIANFRDDFSELGFRDLIGQLNTLVRAIGLENMQGQVIENIAIPAGTSVNIGHSLKVVPKYRIILRQIDGGVIIDGDNTWTETLISLKNDGASDTIISVFLIRS